MICSANLTTVSMWNTTLGWNGLNKRESFMAVITKVNPIHIRPFQGSQALGGGVQKSLCWC